MYGADFHGFIYKKNMNELILFSHDSWKTFIIIITLPADRVSFFHSFARWTNNWIGVVLGTPKRSYQEIWNVQYNIK